MTTKHNAINVKEEHKLKEHNQNKAHFQKFQQCLLEQHTSRKEAKNVTRKHNVINAKEEHKLKEHNQNKKTLPKTSTMPKQDT